MLRRLAPALLIGALIAVGCAKNESTTDSATATVTASPDIFGSETAAPEAAADASGPPVAADASAPAVAAVSAAASGATTVPSVAPSTVATTAAAPVAVAAATASPSSTLRHVALTDISGTLAHDTIVQLAQLGIVEPATGAFHPHAPLTRATFVRWLVKANNTYFPTQGAIRLPETGDDPIFVDVLPSSSDFRYIQGLADAGFVIGIDAKHFAPARNITREELLAIYVGQEATGGMPHVDSIADANTGLTDASQISKAYWNAVNADGDLFYNRSSRTRIFGQSKMFHPQRLATREEAAIAISSIQNGTSAAAVKSAGP